MSSNIQYEEYDEKVFILKELINEWFINQKDPYNLSKDKIKDQFILSDFIAFELPLSLEELKSINLVNIILDELMKLHLDFIDFQFKHIDAKVFKKCISKEKQQKLLISTKGYVSLTEIAELKQMIDMRNRALKVCADMEANYCDTESITKYIVSLNKGIEFKKGGFDLKPYLNRMRNLIEKELMDNNIEFSIDNLNKILINLNQRYLKEITSNLINFNYSNLPKE